MADANLVVADPDTSAVLTVGVCNIQDLSGSMSRDIQGPDDQTVQSPIINNAYRIYRICRMY